MHYARREVRMWLVWEWLSENKMSATDKTVFFVLGSNSFCCTAAVHSARLCGSFGKEKRRSRVDPAPARRVQPIITHDCGILFEKSLTWNRSSQKKKIRPHRLIMPQQPLQWTWSNMKQEWGSSEEQKSLPTNLHTNLHLKWTQWSFARIFCPQWRTSIWCKKLAQGSIAQGAQNFFHNYLWVEPYHLAGWKAVFKIKWSLCPWDLSLPRAFRSKVEWKSSSARVAGWAQKRCVQVFDDDSNEENGSNQFPPIAV